MRCTGNTIRLASFWDVSALTKLKIAARRASDILNSTQYAFTVLLPDGSTAVQLKSNASGLWRAEAFFPDT